MSASSLLGHMMEELIEAGIEIHFHSKRKIESDDGGSISGGFDEEDRHLEVAVKRDDWLEVIAHEYCHFKQWQEGVFNDIEQIAAYSVFTPWLLKKREIPLNMLDGFIKKMQWLEWDNEKRTIQLLKEFRVDFDEEKYIRKANVYLLSYELCKRVRKWHKDSLYDIPELLDIVDGDELYGPEEWDYLPDGYQALAMPCYDFSGKEEEEE